MPDNQPANSCKEEKRRGIVEGCDDGLIHVAPTTKQDTEFQGYVSNGLITVYKMNYFTFLGLDGRSHLDIDKGEVFQGVNSADAKSLANLLLNLVKVADQEPSELEKERAQREKTMELLRSMFAEFFPQTEHQRNIRNQVLLHIYKLDHE